MARELKYREFNTDFTELQRELHGDEDSDTPVAPRVERLAGEDDPYADLYGEPAPGR